MKRSKKHVSKLLTYYGGAPVAQAGPHSVEAFPLAEARAGDRLWLDEAVGSLGLGCCDRLGLQPGATLRVFSVRPSGSVIFGVEGHNKQQIGVGAALARQIWVSYQYCPVPIGNSQNGTLDPLTTDLRETVAGSAVRVVGYEWIYRGYMGKLLSLGLAPGVEFVVSCLRPHSKAIEIELAGTRLALNETEAKALIVEPIE